MQSTAIKKSFISLLLGLTTILILKGSRPASAQTNQRGNRANIPSRSYLGIGGNIGIDSESTTLGDGGFSLVGRTVITKNISLHTSTIFSNDSVSTFAVTFGIPIFKSSNDQLELLYPFVGGGIAVENIFSDFDTDGLVTAGVDVPIIKRITATARLNVGLSDDDTDVGLLLGVGYNFSIFELF
ncbi:MAG: hypothetical protein AAF383_00595 [Cyanobacteria bacterium P01_A01_bin.83]